LDFKIIKPMYKNRVFKISLIIFIAINLIIFKNLGLYNDDWLFYNINNQTFLEWSLRVWNGEGGVIKRHVVVPYYIILHLVSPFFIYCFSLILSLIIFVFFIQLITKIVNQNILDKNKKDISLNFIFLTFVIWYFFPFNIGGQFWITGIIHTKLSTIFFLISLKFLTEKKIFLSLIFLSLSFNSYEIFFFSYLPISLIFYYGGLADKKNFKIFFFGSLVVQLFFLINKIRPENSIEKIDYLNVFNDTFLNLGKLLWGIFSTIPIEISIYIKLILITVIIIMITLISIKTTKIYKNNFFQKFILLLIFSLILNSFVMTLGKYGYWGKGIFSRTMFMPSILFLFFISIILCVKTKVNTIFIFFFFIINILLFINEINNWKKSKNIQTEIIENLKILKQFENKKNLILFKGPCYINGVDIFNATWDLNSAVEINYPELSSNNFIPTQDWKISLNNNQKLIVHIFEYKLENYENLVLWEYDKSNFKILNTSQDVDIKSLSSIKCNIGSNEKNRAKNFLNSLKKL
tara:strand:- start:1420 stop:2979 length:1560 start_codon:yes stop_codon:yes gene_type:complete